MAIPYETDNPVFGRTNNPHNALLTAGGSSGGEAAAIAACLSPAGLGSDLSGSIRVPAHFCGIAGLKPTAGRVPMDGHTPPPIGPLSLGASIGPMARQVRDLGLLFKVIADATQSETKNDELSAGLSVASLAGTHVAVFYGDDAVPITEETFDTLKAAATALSEAGLEVNEAKPPGIAEGSRLWIDLFSRAAREQLQEMYRGRESEAGPLVSSTLRASISVEDELGAKIDRAETLARALVERERLREDILRWMKTTPLILMPVGSVPAFAHGASRVEVRGESLSIFRAFGKTHAANVFGLPSAVVPAGRSAEGLPIGVQIVGRPFEEGTVLAAAAAIEEAHGGWQRPSSEQNFSLS
jgi:Asp-tRNA(Asn)/Glu-tRNA(Gln) amidotransferase A subunit family amidase